MLKVLDLFSGIGGFSLGLERTGGFETVAFCEIEKFPQKVLAKHWPEVPIYEDVRNVTAKQLRADGIIPNVITGGFPCQDISVAGNQKGMGEGTRSGLWSECARLVGEIRPRYAIFENVTALLSGDNGRWFQRVLFDLSEVGYDAEWHCIPASELGANHHRDRVWIIVYPSFNGGAGERGKLSQTDEQQAPKRQEGRLRKSINASSGRVDSENVPNTMRERLEGYRQFGKNEGAARQARQPILSDHCKGSIQSECWAVEPSVGRVANGIPDRSHRLKGLGNAICPPISELIGRAILEAENEAM